MSNNTSFSENMDTIFNELQDFVKTESMMGTPIKVEDKTLVPVVSVTLGYGSGAKNPNNNNMSSMTPDNNIGLGARVTTNAVVVVDKESVSMLPVNEKSNMNQSLNQLIDKIPEFLNGNKQQDAQNDQSQQ